MKRYKNVYVPIPNRMIRLFKKSGITSAEEVKKILLKQALDGSSNAKAAITTEHAWDRAGCTTVFIPRDVEEFVGRSKFTISEEAFRIPTKRQVAAFVFESGGTGLLWQSSLRASRVYVMDMLNTYLGPKQFNVDFDDEKYNDGFATADERSLWLVSGDLRDLSILTEIYPTRLLIERLSHPEGLRTMAITSPYDIAPTEDDATHMRDLLMRIVKVCIYICAFPDLLIPGWPEGVQTSQVILPRVQRHSHEIRLPKESKRGVAMHLREGHFRALAHERFHRDTNGNIRIVQVNPAVVGGKVDPKTVHKSK